MNSQDTAQPEGLSAFPQAATLEFVAASKRYAGSDEHAVESLSLRVEAGEICVLVGPSGCGKTTAMRMVNRMIDMTSGDILLDGRSVRERRPADLRREIGYVIQQIGLFPHQTVAENIGTVPRLLGWDKHRVRERVARAARPRRSRASSSPTATRASSPAASASASASPGRWPPTRR